LLNDEINECYCFYRVKLFIDDEEGTEFPEPLPQITEEIVVDHLYIGGVPMGLPNGQLMVANINGLYGCLSNIILNGM